MKAGDLVKISVLPIGATPWMRKMYTTQEIAVVVNTTFYNRDYVQIYWNGRMRLPSVDLLKVVSKNG